MSTGSKTATGFIRPVLEVFHTISSKVVSASSSLHLKANESFGNFAVIPSERLYGMLGR